MIRLLLAATGVVVLLAALVALWLFGAMEIFGLGPVVRVMS